MKRVTSIIAKALVTILMSGWLLVVSVQAEGMSGVEANIPFEFSTYGQKNIASGTYHLELLSDPFLLSIRNLKTGRKQILMVHQAESPSPATHGYLIFRRDGDHSYLAEIHFKGSTVYSELFRKEGPAGTKENGGIIVALTITALQ